MMNRRQVLKKLQAAAKSKGLNYSVEELTRHTGVTVGGQRSTISRHAEVAESTAQAFWKQFEDELGKGWWR
jgi:hypothetical protein